MTKISKFKILNLTYYKNITIYIYKGIQLYLDSPKLGLLCENLEEMAQFL